jgi:hypothetical protein
MLILLVTLFHISTLIYAEQIREFLFTVRSYGDAICVGTFVPLTS